MRRTLSWLTTRMMGLRWFVLFTILVVSLATAEDSADPTSAFLRLAVVVSDLEQSKRFYTYALGYRVQFEGDIGRPIVKQQLGLDPEQTVSFVILVSDNVIDGQQLEGAMLGLLQIGGPAPPVMRRPNDADLAIGEGMLAVRTSDIETVYQRLQELNARILLAPLRSPDGGQVELVVHDPDGIRIHVVQRFHIETQPAE
jgi:catechol 2,3-dioxygenase-like lactoylglutathione lyase family enzyme